jgi:hypothetical protein
MGEVGIRVCRMPSSPITSYQESLKMAPFEMLYGRRCWTLLFRSEAGERKVFGPDILLEVKKQVRMVTENLWVAQSRQKSYADHRRRELSFEVGDFVYLKVSPMKGLRRFRIRGKLALRFIEPFKILEKSGEVAYNWSCRHSCLTCMMYSMYLSWRNVYACLKSNCLWKIWMLRKIFLTKSTLSRFWKHQRGLLKTRRSECARCNRVITPRKKLLGKENKNWRWSFQVSFLTHPNLGDEIHFKGLGL